MLCVATAFGAAAQQQCSKTLDRAMKSEGPKRHDIRAMLKGAMTNAGNGKRRENLVSRRQKRVWQLE